MKIKLFQKNEESQAKELEQELVLSGLIRANKNWVQKDKVTIFVRSGLGDIRVYWDKLPKDIKTKVFERHIVEFDAMMHGKPNDSVATPNHSNSTNYKELMAIGLEETFSPDRYGDRSKRKVARGKILAENHPELLKSSIAHMEIDAQRNILLDISANSFYILKDPEWILYLKSIVAKIDMSNSYHVLRDALGHLIMQAVDLLYELTGEINLFELYTRLEAKSEQANMESPVLEKLVELTAKHDGEALIKHVKNVSFKKKKLGVRAVVYRGLIKAGFLDEKIARRIRSDSSERVSTSCIKALFDVLETYPNKDELIGQFLDTRYDRVGMELVTNSPDKYLPFLVGVKGQAAKKLLEKKMEQAAKNGTL
jgi:hypothetical protein